MATTADVTPQFMEGIVASAPDLLADLSPAQWRAFSPPVVAVALDAVAGDLDPQLAAQLQAIQDAASGVAPQPQPLAR